MRLRRADVQTAQQQVIDSVQAAVKADNAMLKAGLCVESDQKIFHKLLRINKIYKFQAALELNAGNENWDAKIRVNAEKDPQIDNDQDGMLRVIYCWKIV